MTTAAPPARTDTTGAVPGAPAPVGQPPATVTSTAASTTGPEPGATAPGGAATTTEPREQPATPTSAGPAAVGPLLERGRFVGSYINDAGGVEITAQATGYVSYRTAAGARPNARFHVTAVNGPVATATIDDLTSPDPTGVLAAGRVLTLHKIGGGLRVEQLSAAEGGGRFCDVTGDEPCQP